MTITWPYRPKAPTHKHIQYVHTVATHRSWCILSLFCQYNHRFCHNSWFCWICRHSLHRFPILILLIGSIMKCLLKKARHRNRPSWITMVSVKSGPTQRVLWLGVLDAVQVVHYLYATFLHPFQSYIQGGNFPCYFLYCTPNEGQHTSKMGKFLVRLGLLVKDVSCMVTDSLVFIKWIECLVQIHTMISQMRSIWFHLPAPFYITTLQVIQIPS